jgi:uncharacterized protein (DUF4415 family)
MMKAARTAASELSAFERDLLESVRQAMASEFVGDSVTYSPAAIETLKRRGRPVGSSKQSTTLRIEESALSRWRATGKGWQTRAAQVLALHAPA